MIRRLAIGPPVARLGAPRRAGTRCRSRCARRAARATTLPDARLARPSGRRPASRWSTLRGFSAGARRRTGAPRRRPRPCAGRGRRADGAQRRRQDHAAAVARRRARARARATVRVDGHAPRPGRRRRRSVRRSPSRSCSPTPWRDEVRSTLARPRAPDDARPRSLAELGHRGPAPAAIRATSRPASGCSSRRPRSPRPARRCCCSTSRRAGSTPTRRSAWRAFLRTHAGGGGAVVFATHDVELAAAVATRVVMLAGGEVVADGDPGGGAGRLARLRAADDPRRSAPAGSRPSRSRRRWR